MPSVQLNITRNVICNTKCVFTTSLILELTWEIVSVALSNNRLRISFISKFCENQAQDQPVQRYYLEHDVELQD